MGIEHYILEVRHPIEGSFVMKDSSEASIQAVVYWPFDLDTDDFIEINEKFSRPEWARAKLTAIDSEALIWQVTNEFGARVEIFEQDGRILAQVSSRREPRHLARSVQIPLPGWPEWIT